MSLTKCKICGQPLSEEALFCPHCGHPYHIKEYLIAKELPSAPPVIPENAETPEKPDNSEPSITSEEAAEARYRRNERLKLWIFVAASAIILATILYFYFTTTPGETQEAEETEMVEEPVQQLASPDSLAPVSNETAATEVPTAKPAAAPATPAKPAATAAPKTVTEPEETPDVTVRSLREQAAPAHSDEPQQPEE